MENIRYKQNGYMENMGIIPNDSYVGRRQIKLQEQQNRKAQEAERRKRRRIEKLRREKRKRIRICAGYAGAIAIVLFGVWMINLKKTSRQDAAVENATSQSMITEVQQPVQEDTTPKQEDVVQDAVAVTSQALPDYYQKKYIVDVPTHFSEEEIDERLGKLAQEYPEFHPILEHKDEYPEALLNNLCYNPNMLDFALGYLDNLNQTNAVLEDSELTADIPLFIQWDKRWGYKLYGSSVVGLVGCGPTCLAMVVTGLTRNTRTTPDVLASYAETNGYYVYGAGTSWAFMDEAGSLYGVQATRIPISEEQVMDELREGHPIICSMNPGDFTAEGHFIVIAGLENGDKLRINDPNSIERSNMLWDYDKIASQISGMWAYQLAE